MNINRDPFGLRPSIAPNNAFSVLQQSAARNAARYSQKIVESGQQALESGRQALEDVAASDQWQAVQQTATDAMAFAVPRNVPNFDGPQRRFEDSAWASSGRSRFPASPAPDTNNGVIASSSSAAGAAGAAVTDRLGGMFGDGGKELPMYKDKPYNYGSSARRGWFRRRRTLIFCVLAFFVFLYWFGVFSNSEENKGTSGSGLFSGMMSGKTSAVVDWDERRDRVRDAFKLSWDAYEKYAWGYDEFHPVSKKGRQMVPGGMGWIIVDALDTLILMNLTTQLTHAREWVSTSLDYEKDHDVNTFETTIRMLGGLLSAHYLSTEFPHYAPIALKEGEEDLFQEKAADLADRLLGAYESNSGIPYASINLKTGEGIRSHADGGASSTAEATSLQLEMKYIAKLTGEVHYWERAEKIMKVVDDLEPEDGLVPIFINPDRGVFQGHNIRLGSRGDSYYEYLIKQYLQTSKQEPVYKEMWEETLYGMRKHLITYSSSANLTVLGERPNGLGGDLSPKIDHLVCFLPGTIALGATEGKTLAEARQSPSWGKKQEDDMELARELMKTCWGMYKVTATGLAPEITYFKVDEPPRMWESWADKVTSPAELDDSNEANWKSDYDIKVADRHNLQRPETVESLFYMWRITGEVKYREWGWEMFQAFVKYTLVEDGSGFTSINDVTNLSPPARDNMESFWLAETLKYLYLLFGPDDILPLTNMVLNTEAHPLPQFEMGKLFKTGWERKPRSKGSS
ncbi:Endoplasmic reticulum mannosyl-oligosaccharide 1 [Lasiodiplodia hormozganensis]|uniref:alpha-1,2-Mannosidase n=1 Tax=Lasiodiplodia hormozganensis TaxID=869390 RepID=A0AA39XP71_9PEZI|nr:Endoplasmic reticulum mannosyl-oligosaccharide 1 [Lasiodiplodia hormozganensis]